MDTCLLTALLFLVTALGLWISMPHTKISPGNPLSTRILKSLPATVAPFLAASILNYLLSGGRPGFLELPGAFADTITDVSAASSIPTVTVTSILPPGPGQESGNVHNSFRPLRRNGYFEANQQPEWIVNTVFVVMYDEFWRNPNLYTVLAAALIPLWFTLRRILLQQQTVSAAPIQQTSEQGAGTSQAAALNTVSTRLDELSTNFRTLDQRVNNIMTTVTRSSERSGAMRDETNNLKGRFGDLLPEFKSLQTEVKSLAAQSSALKERIKSQEDLEEIRKAEAPDKDVYLELDSLQKQCQDLLVSTSTSRNSSDKISSQVSALSEKLESYRETTVAKQKQVDSLSGQLQKLREEATSKWAELGSNFDSISERVGVLEEEEEEQPQATATPSLHDTNALYQDVRSLQRDSASKSAQDDMETRLRSITARFEQRPWDLTTNAIRERLQELETDIIELRQISTSPKSKPALNITDDTRQELVRKIERTDGRISNLRTEFDELRLSSGRNGTNLSELTQRVDSVLTEKPWENSGQNTVPMWTQIDEKIRVLSTSLVSSRTHQALADRVETTATKQKEISLAQDSNSQEMKYLSSQLKHLGEEHATISTQYKELIQLPESVNRLQAEAARHADLESLRNDISQRPILSQDQVRQLRALLDDVHITNEKTKQVEAALSSFQQNTDLKTKQLEESTHKQEVNLNERLSEYQVAMQEAMGKINELQGRSGDDSSDTRQKLSEYDVKLRQINSELDELRAKPSTGRDEELRQQLSDYDSNVQKMKTAIEELQARPNTGAGSLDPKEREFLTTAKSKLNDTETRSMRNEFDIQMIREVQFPDVKKLLNQQNTSCNAMNQKLTEIMGKSGQKWEYDIPKVIDLVEPEQPPEHLRQKPRAPSPPSPPVPQRRSRWDPEYEGPDKLGDDKPATKVADPSPPVPQRRSRWDPEYEGPDKLGDDKPATNVAPLVPPSGRGRGGRGSDHRGGKGGTGGRGAGNGGGPGSKLPKKPTEGGPKGSPGTGSTHKKASESSGLRGSSWASDTEAEEASKKS